jgi:hypothetical protein
MAGDAVAFAREWDADAQALRLAAMYRTLLRAPTPILDHQTVTASR